MKRAISVIAIVSTFSIVIWTVVDFNRHPSAHTLPPHFIRESIDATMAGDCKMVGDIDGDGFPDVAIAGLGPSEPLTWYRFPDWHKTVIASSQQEWSNYGVIADVNGDGNNDIVLPDGELTPNNLFWFENPGGNLALTVSNWIKHGIGYTTKWCKDVFVQDFDGDGLVDVVARPYNMQPVIFFQTAPNTWSEVTFSGLTVGQEGLWADDIDGDNNIDLIVQGQGILNPGGSAARTSANWIKFDIGSAPTNFKAFTADMNGDNRIDVLFSSSEDLAPIVWYEQSASGPIVAWTLHNVHPSVSKAHTLWAADFDLDGDNDIVAASIDQKKIFGYQNIKGDGTVWQKYLIDSGSDSGIHNGQVTDFDQDGDPDIFGAGFTGQVAKASVWMNQTNNPILPVDQWSYIELTDEHERTFGLTFWDIDQDGLIDVVSGNAWYRNPGGDMTGVWTKTLLPNGMHAVLMANVDDDGIPDIIAIKNEGATAWYWIEPSSAVANTWNIFKFGETPAASHALGPQGFRYKELIPGGKPEIVATSGDGAYYFTIPLSDFAANKWEKVKISSNPSDEELDVGDIDRDGYPDIVATTGSSKRVEWYQNPGERTANWTAYVVGTFPPETVYPDRCSLADLNGDGRLDIIATEENGAGKGAKTYWWEQPASATSETWHRHLLAEQGSTNSMTVADMDRDGDMDVLLGEHRGSKLLATLWKNNGKGSFTSYCVGRGHESHYGVRTVDLDSDGDIDLVSIAYDDQQHIHLWRNDAIVLPNL